MRWILTGLFVFSALTKSFDLNKFAVKIAEFGIVAEGTEFVTAVFIVVFELVVGFGLLIDVKGSLSAITSLLLIFLAVLCYGIWLGLDIDCGCFGDDIVHFTTGLQDAVWKDIVLLTIVVAIFCLRKKLGIVPKSIWKYSSQRENVVKQSVNQGD